jgi:hypothetical protein
MSSIVGMIGVVSGEALPSSWNFMVGLEHGAPLGWNGAEVVAHKATQTDR